ncbi:hypothetical protein BURCENK562V_C2350 [Burkholderia cenocepacia K56-2Valvano]|nr:hypothetical protein BURCENK562V_C2350 [Burkholderia cenocepacia K56-2Valvano]
MARADPGRTGPAAVAAGARRPGGGAATREWPAGGRPRRLAGPRSTPPAGSGRR